MTPGDCISLSFARSQSPICLIFKDYFPVNHIAFGFLPPWGDAVGRGSSMGTWGLGSNWKTETTSG